MRIDADTPARAELARDFDLCVIGAGPAGITLARRAAAQGLSVALMEGGGEDLTVESQELYEGAVVGRDYFPLDTPRLRFLGGSSNHWAGWCRALDAVDFEAKAWNPMSGWPIAKADLDPYQPATDAILDLIPAAAAPDLPSPLAGAEFTRFQFRWSPPTNFREKYAAELAASDRITLALNANLVDLRLDEGLGRVEAAAFRGHAAGDDGFSLRARAYALCCGGIENPRLLLNFTGQIAGRDRQRGRPRGTILLRAPAFRAGRDHPARSDGAARTVLLPADRGIPARDRDAELRDADRAPARAVRAPARARSRETRPAPTRSCCGCRERIADVAPACAPGGDGAIVFDGLMRIAYEQALNPDSRVRLGAERDRLGLRQAALDWRLSELDLRTMRTAARAFAARLAEQDVGRARLRDWVLADPIDWPDTTEDEVGGKHHMGTTRMADDPRRGVVDRNCRVHGIDNLYVGGSSVFATGGQANPTYTVVQLALRLGDHLGRTLRA